MKELYAEVVLNKDELVESESNRIELEYYKISKKASKEQSNLYGVEIVKKEYLGNKSLEEKEDIDCLTNDETVVNNLLSVLKRNKVTPICLNEILDEVL